MRSGVARSGVDQVEIALIRDDRLTGGIYRAEQTGSGWLRAG